MKYKLMLDENNYIEGFIHMDNEEDVYELNASEMKLDYLSCYKLVNNEIIFDEDKYNATINKESIKNEIASLKAELSSTDYQIIKCSEYQLQGLNAPYNITALHATRQALRDRINELEAKI